MLPAPWLCSVDTYVDLNPEIILNSFERIADIYIYRWNNIVIFSTPSLPLTQRIQNWLGELRIFRGKKASLNSVYFMVNQDLLTLCQKYKISRKSPWYSDSSMLFSRSVAKLFILMLHNVTDKMHSSGTSVSGWTW